MKSLINSLTRFFFEIKLHLSQFLVLDSYTNSWSHKIESSSMWNLIILMSKVSVMLLQLGMDILQTVGF